MKKLVYYNDLFDIYGKLLTNKEQETFIDYYQEDLSLQEIADNRGVSKSAIGYSIQVVAKKLENYENMLKFYEQKEKILKEITKINDEELKNKLINILES